MLGLKPADAAHDIATRRVIAAQPRTEGREAIPRVIEREPERRIVRAFGHTAGCSTISTISISTVSS